MRRRSELAEARRSQVRTLFEAALAGRAADGVALAAVGSLARADGGPLSDYDLVLLYDSRGHRSGDVGQLADRIWYPLWDSGVRLDHSVRTVAECRAVASRDLTATVGLLDLTHLAGDQQIVSAARSTVAHDWRANARTRLGDLSDAVASRHLRHGDLAHLSEPDLKEARGGLRDMAVIRALTAAWLTDRPHGEVDAAYQRVLDVRDACHTVTGKARDRLGREDHDGIAELLGYAETDDLLADLSQSARVIAYSLDATMRRATQSQRARILRVGPRRPALTPLGYGLNRHEGEVVLGAGVLQGADAVLALRAAVVAARNSLPLSPQTLSNVATLPAPGEPWPTPARELLGELLATGPGLVAVWEGLDLAGIIEQWIPEWRAVRSRPQRSLVHRHTVDRHLIETVVRAQNRLSEVSRPDLLLVAALLHDIGKVSGASDHSETGAGIARQIVARMGFSAADADVIVLLVREHLTLVELATRRDPTDPATIAALSQAVDGRLDVLDLLRALTEADASAAGPKAWSDWRAHLVGQLYALTRASLEASAPIAAVVGDSGDPDTAGLPTGLAETVDAGGVYVGITRVGGGLRVELGTQDGPGLFADSASLFASRGFVVRSAMVRTIDRYAVNQWFVESPHGDSLSADDLGRELARLRSGDRPKPRPRAPRAPGESRQVRADIVPAASSDATVLEVRAEDRPRLLFDIGSALDRIQVVIKSAHVATYAAQAIDTFYLLDRNGRPLSPARATEAAEAVRDACGHVAAGPD